MTTPSDGTPAVSRPGTSKRTASSLRPSTVAAPENLEVQGSCLLTPEPGAPRPTSSKSAESFIYRLDPLADPPNPPNPAAASDTLDVRAISSDSVGHSHTQIHSQHRPGHHNLLSVSSTQIVFPERPESRQPSARASATRLSVSHRIANAVSDPSVLLDLFSRPSSAINLAPRTASRSVRDTFTPSQTEINRVTVGEGISILPDIVGFGLTGGFGAPVPTLIGSEPPVLISDPQGIVAFIGREAGSSTAEKAASQPAKVDGERTNAPKDSIAKSKHTRGRRRNRPKIAVVPDEPKDGGEKAKVQLKNVDIHMEVQAPKVKRLENTTKSGPPTFIPTQTPMRNHHHRSRQFGITSESESGPLMIDDSALVDMHLKPSFEFAPLEKNKLPQREPRRTHSYQFYRCLPSRAAPALASCEMLSKDLVGPRSALREKFPGTPSKYQDVCELLRWTYPGKPPTPEPPQHHHPQPNPDLPTCARLHVPHLELSHSLGMKPKPMRVILDALDPSLSLQHGVNIAQSQSDTAEPSQQQLEPSDRLPTSFASQYLGFQVRAGHPHQLPAPLPWISLLEKWKIGGDLTIVADPGTARKHDVAGRISRSSSPTHGASSDAPTIPAEVPPISRPLEIAQQGRKGSRRAPAVLTIPTVPIPQ